MGEWRGDRVGEWEWRGREREREKGDGVWEWLRGREGKRG